MKILPYAWLVVGAGLASPRIQAQYTIPRFVIAGGGLVSTGGSYAGAGTVAQAGAGAAASGGNYALVGGFWPGAILAPRSDSPTLSAEIIAGNGVRLSWPLSAAGFVLGQTASLAPPPGATVWTPVSLPTQTNAGRVSVTIPAPARNTFYRLRRP